MNKLVTISIQSKQKKHSFPLTHTLTVSIHDEILKNKARLVSHCRSVARRSYGNGIEITCITSTDGQTLWENKNETAN